jgi:hypothetical protein
MTLSGATPGSMVENFANVAPTSALELGVASIVAAFALLALGFARSLGLPRANPERETTSDGW